MLADSIFRANRLVSYYVLLTSNLKRKPKKPEDVFYLESDKYYKRQKLKQGQSVEDMKNTLFSIFRKK